MTYAILHPDDLQLGKPVQSAFDERRNLLRFAEDVQHVDVRFERDGVQVLQDRFAEQSLTGICGIDRNDPVAFQAEISSDEIGRPYRIHGNPDACECLDRGQQVPKKFVGIIFVRVHVLRCGCHFSDAVMRQWVAECSP